VVLSLFFQTCGELIALTDPALSHGDYSWHGTDECFKCTFCKVSFSQHKLEVLSLAGQTLYLTATPGNGLVKLNT